MRIHAIVFLSLGLWLTAWAQPPDSLWSRSYGGDVGEICYAVKPTADGGFILGGVTWSFGAGNADAWLVKTDANGDSMWSRTYGGTSGDWCYSVSLCSDGGYALAGFRQVFSEQFWLVRTNAAGDTLWSRDFGAVDRDEFCWAVEQAADGGFILAGNSFATGDSHPDVWLLKTNADGDSVWSRRFGLPFQDELCFAVRQTADGGYVLAGSNDYAFWLIKTDVSGDSLWSRRYSSGGADLAHSVLLTDDGGYALAGYSYIYQSPTLTDYWLLKANSEGDSLWSRRYGDSYNDLCWCAETTMDGGYVLGGSSQLSEESLPDYWMVKVNGIGDSVWSCRYGSPDEDMCMSVGQTADGSYFLGGSAYLDGPIRHFCLIKTAPELFAPPSFIPHPSSFLLSAYPNPFNATAQIRFDLPRASLVQLDVYDVTGRLVENLASRVFVAGTHSVAFDGSNRASGTYVVRMTSAHPHPRAEAGGKWDASQKVILVK